MSTEETSGSRSSSQRRTGRCKWFNVVKGYGFITPDDGQPDVFLHQTVIQMHGFRSLAEGELVEFEAKSADKGPEATFVCGLGGTDCKGSDRRPAGKRKTRKIRCYNCGEFANHVAARCPVGRQPKRCHHCKSEDHLIADCPQRSATDASGTASPLKTTASPTTANSSSTAADSKSTTDSSRPSNSS